TSSFSLILTLFFLIFDGFEYLDNISISYSENPLIIELVFFGILMIGRDILSSPFSYYKTFVIEERFGFNKTSKKTFVLDKIKGWLMMVVLGGSILALIIWFYQFSGDNFWLYAWALMTVFTIIMNMFYAKLIV